MNQKNIFLDAVHQLLELDINDFNSLTDNICRTMNKAVPGIIFSSILTFNKKTNEIVYRTINCNECKKNSHTKETLTELIRDRIILEVDNSASGRLIKSRENYLILPDVLKDKDYKSTKLAKFLKLKKAIILKIHDIRTNNIYGVFIIYPDKCSPLNQITDCEIETIRKIVENIISNSKRIKENYILTEILKAAEKVKKDLSSFLHKCVEIISNEILAKGCSIFTVDPADGLIRLRATLGIRPGPKQEFRASSSLRKENVFYRKGEGLTGKIVEQNKVIIHHNIDTSQSKWVEQHTSSNFLGIPIQSTDKKKAIGVLRCSTKPNRLLGSKLESFNHEDINLITYISKLISVFIELSYSQDNQKKLITKMPHEITASLQNIGSVCDYLEYVNKKHAGFSRINCLQKLNDIREECKLSMMTVNSVSAFEDEIEDYQFERIDIFTEIIAKVRKMLNPIAVDERNVKIYYDNENGMPKIFGDKHKIQLVFHNVIMNAVKYSRKFVRQDENTNIAIHYSLNNETKCHEISISNWGIEIPKGMENDIFVNGIRAPEAAQIAPGGRGFGLALAKNILKMHKGDIKVTRRKDPTVFTLYFPSGIIHKKPNKISYGGCHDITRR